MATTGTPAQLETAHVLFIDLVGYSTQPMAVQRRLLEELQELVRLTPEFSQASGNRDSLCLPTSDGMALVFFHDPVAPLRSAMEIARLLPTRAAAETPLLLRMGLHTGPVYRVEDINANSNVSGGGINFAQRVMDCGDAGHILLSSHIVDQLTQVGSWPLHDLGIFEVKHGERLHLFNLYTEELGNARLPEKLRPAAATSEWPGGGAAPATAVGLRVALLYKRNAEPDQHVLHLLEKALNQRGCRVFVDRHLAVGMEWAREIDRQIRASDAVIPLLSTASVQSEMLAHEVQTAQEAAQAQHGRPRLLGAHPYLVRRGLHEIVTTGMALNLFEAQADREDGIYGDHLRRILVLLARDSVLCNVVRGVLRGEPCPDADSFYRLRSAGVMIGSAMNDVRPRCRLYESYLTRHLH